MTGRKAYALINIKEHQVLVPKFPPLKRQALPNSVWILLFELRLGFLKLEQASHISRLEVEPVIHSTYTSYYLPCYLLYLKYYNHLNFQKYNTMHFPY